MVAINKMNPSAAIAIFFALQAFALSPDPSGQSKIGNAAHQSSIGSQCTSSLDCGANGNIACCAFLPQGGQTIGICSGCGATTQQGKQGCGFGDQGKDLASDPQVCPASSFASASASGATAAAAAAPAASGSGLSTAASSPSCARRRRRSAKHEQRRASRRAPAAQRRAAQLPDPGLDAGAGNGRHAQFVTGKCLDASDCGAEQADLSNVCCASVADAATGQTVGVCSGSAVGDAAPKLGCGFGDGLANSALAGTGGAANGTAAAAAAADADAAAAADAASPADAACTNEAAATASSSPSASPAAGTAAKLPDPALDKGKGNQQNQQFVTGACINSKDCGAEQTDLSAVCCASVESGGQVVGVCSGSAVGNAAPKMGCGFGDGKANSAA